MGLISIGESFFCIKVFIFSLNCFNWDFKVFVLLSWLIKNVDIVLKVLFNKVIFFFNELFKEISVLWFCFIFRIILLSLWVIVVVKDDKCFLCWVSVLVILLIVDVILLICCVKILIFLIVVNLKIDL